MSSPEAPQGAANNEILRTDAAGHVLFFGRDQRGRATELREGGPAGAVGTPRAGPGTPTPGLNWGAGDIWPRGRDLKSIDARSTAKLAARWRLASQASSRSGQSNLGSA